MKAFKRKLAVIVIILSVTFLVVVAYSSKRGEKSALENYTGIGFNVFQKYFYKAGIQVKDYIMFIKNFSQVKEENEKLKEENNKLKDKLASYEIIKEQNNRLRSILNYTQLNTQYNYVVCDVIGKSGNAYVEQFILNKGKSDGIDKNMAVINSYGLIGQVTSVGDNWSLVETIESKNIAVGGYILDTKEYMGIVRGYVDKNNKPLAKLYYLPIDSKVKVGDQVFTGIVNNDEVESGIYPKGIRIGTVIDLEEDKINMMKTALIRPHVDFNKIEEVTVIVPKVSRKIND